MKTLSSLFALLLAALTVVGCDRTFTTEVENTTPPELHVFVEDASGARVQGATVSLYRSEADRTSGTNAILTATTDAEGRVIADEATLETPGIVYVAATKDTLTGQGSTPYLLLNDGVTYFEVILQ